MKILIVGGTGMLGGDSKAVLSKDHKVIAPSHGDLDMISWDRVIENLQQISPDAVLNCAAFTDVDGCEIETFTTRKTNVEGPRNLAQGAARFESKLVHISCNHVFDGYKPVPQPYFEDDTEKPLSAYGKSKAESEKAVRENSPSYIIIRTGWLYGRGGNGFLKSIISAGIDKSGKELKIVDDQFGSPTWTFRLAEQICLLMERQGKGTYHATAEAYCSRFEYASFVLDKLGMKRPVVPCTSTTCPTRAKRPVNTILENRLLKKQGLNLMRNWKEDLNEFLDRFGEELIREASGG